MSCRGQRRNTNALPLWYTLFPPFTNANFTPAATKSKKHRKKKSKAANATKSNGPNPQANGVPDTVEEDLVDLEDDAAQANHTDEPSNTNNNEGPAQHPKSPEIKSTEAKSPSARRKSSVTVNGQRLEPSQDLSASEWSPRKAEDLVTPDAIDTTRRLEDAIKENEQLRNEVAELRKAPGQAQRSSADGQDELQTQLEEARRAKDQAETKYNKLLTQVNNIKTQLGERLKADAVCPNIIKLYTEDTGLTSLG